MARTPSKMVPLHKKAPPFSLTNTVNQEKVSLQSSKGKYGTLIMFICNHCPYVKHVNPELLRLAQDYGSKGISFIAISSNDVNAYPQDGPQQMKQKALELGYPFPYLYDETQEVARAYEAACTPDFFVYNKDLLLVYRGQLDDSRPGNNIPLSGKDIRQALDCLIAGNSVPPNQKPSIGCNIKWKELTTNG